MSHKVLADFQPLYRLSRHLRAIPAAQSERQALSGLDPFHLAHLALNDACKAADLAPTAKAYELQVMMDPTKLFTGSSSMDSPTKHKELLRSCTH